MAELTEKHSDEMCAMKTNLLEDKYEKDKLHQNLGMLQYEIATHKE